MFRNVRLYRLHSPWPESEKILSDKLAQVAFRPCGSFSERSSGFEAPGDSPDGLLARRVGGADLFQLRVQSRVLPAAAVEEALEDRLQEFRGRTAREPSRAERRQLKEEMHAELLPKALVKSQRIRGFCLYAEPEGDQLIGIDAANEGQAELILENLRVAMGHLLITPLAYRQPIGTLLSKIFLGRGPKEFSLGRECRMEDPAAGRASVNWLDIDLVDHDVRKHVQNGLKLSRVALVFGDVLSCVIDHEGVIRKLRFPGTEIAEEVVDESLLARLDADFVMLIGNIRQLIYTLKRLLEGFDSASVS